MLGERVAISGQTILLGSRKHNGPAGVDTGAAYVFTRSGTIWDLQQKLVASDAAQGDECGIVSVSGDTVVLGAPSGFSGPVFVATGRAYVFER